MMNKQTMFILFCSRTYADRVPADRVPGHSVEVLQLFW